VSPATGTTSSFNPFHETCTVTLYILKAIPSWLFKIGITDQLDRRLSAIQRQNSEQVLVVSTVPRRG
jgi:Meiotically up-regulated gene 113